MTLYRGPGGTGSATSDADTTLYQDFLNQTIAARDAALQAEINAELAETNAETAETNAETAETNAETAATNAASSASAAASSASSASTSASNASTSASAASTSATNAASSASSASSSASAASTSASNAATSATNAANSASSASTSATNAANSASTATTQATNAASSATAAASSASSASTSATNAANSASSASTSATNAATSATSAAASASAAAASAASIDPTTLVRTTGTQTIGGDKTFSSNPTLSAGTANGVLFLNAGKAIASGTALSFDGSSVTVKTSSGGYLNLDSTAAGTSNTIASLLNNSAAYAPLNYNATAHVYQISSSEGMRLTSTGLGIGTSSPGVKLDISGTGAVGARVSGSTNASLLLNAASGFLNYLQYSSGGLQFYQSNAGINTMLLDASGNLGLGVTPSAWGADTKAIQLGGSLFSAFAADLRFLGLANARWDGTNFRYLNTVPALQYRMSAGTGAHEWYTAPSGTAGNAISFTQAMTLDASGNLLVGATSGSGGIGERIAVTGGGIVTQASAGATRAMFGNFGSSDLYVGSFDNFTMQFRTNNIERARIDTSGNLGIGTTTMTQKVNVEGSIGTRNGGHLLSTASNTNAGGLYLDSSGSKAISLRADPDNDASGTYIGFATDGTERARIDSSGNLGLGVTPSAWRSNWKAFQTQRAALVSDDARAAIGYNWYLDSGATDRYIGSGTALLYQQINGQHLWYNAPSGTAGNAISFTQAMTLTAAGELLVGATSSNGAKIVAYQGSAQSPSTSGNMNTGFVFGQGAPDPVLNFGTDADGVWYNSAYANNAGVARIHRWLIGGSERARITSGGDLLVGKTSTASDVTTAGGFISPSGKAVFTTTTDNQPLVLARNNVTGFLAEFFYGGTSRGSISTNGSTVSYNTSSDYRLKENIQPMTGALSKVAALKPCTYKWKVDGSDGEGFIAHELAEVVPQCVTGEKDAVDADGNPVYQGIDTSFLVATLTAAIQEQQTIINQLKARLDAANL